MRYTISSIIRNQKKIIIRNVDNLYFLRSNLDLLLVGKHVLEIGPIGLTSSRYIPAMSDPLYCICPQMINSIEGYQYEG